MQMFFIYNFFDMRDTKINMTPSCSPCRAGSKHVLFDLKRPTWKFDLRSEVKVWPRSDHDPSRSICTSSEVARRAKSLFGIICTSLFPSCLDLLAKNGLWLHLTSFDIRWPLRDPRSSVAPGSAQMGWVTMILEKLGGFDRFMRNGEYFHISP